MLPAARPAWAVMRPLVALTLWLGALAPGCTWTRGGERHTLVLGLGVVTTCAAAPAPLNEGESGAAHASRLQARGLLVMPGLALIGGLSRHDVRIDPGADAHVEVLDDGAGSLRTLGRVWDAARRPDAAALSARRCLCHGCSGGCFGCGG